jgi:hypothetical protein
VRATALIGARRQQALAPDNVARAATPTPSMRLNIELNIEHGL